MYDVGEVGEEVGQEEGGELAHQEVAVVVRDGDVLTEGALRGGGGLTLRYSRQTKQTVNRFFEGWIANSFYQSDFIQSTLIRGQSMVFCACAKVT